MNPRSRRPDIVIEVPGPSPRPGVLRVLKGERDDTYLPLVLQPGQIYEYTGAVWLCLAWADTPEEWVATEADDPYKIDADAYQRKEEPV
jgi:hypothetical protein